MKKPKDEWAKELFLPLYQEKYTQTLWNTDDKERQLNGWQLISGRWAPWFFNMRPLGDSPQLFCDCCMAMSDLFSLYDDIDLFIAIEMAGINSSGGMAVASLLLNKIGRRIGYTRPLPIKPRNPEAAAKILKEIDQDVAGYGQKSFVEARMRDGDIIAVYDDMATNLGSKIIARTIVLWQAKLNGISVSCDWVFYLLNRSEENKQLGIDFAQEKNQDLFPSPLCVDYIIEFNEHLPSLKKVMQSSEYRVISDYQDNPKQFQDKEVRKEVLVLANKARK